MKFIVASCYKQKFEFQQLFGTIIGIFVRGLKTAFSNLVAQSGPKLEEIVKVYTLKNEMPHQGNFVSNGVKLPN